MVQQEDEQIYRVLLLLAGLFCAVVVLMPAHGFAQTVDEIKLVQKKLLSYRTGEITGNELSGQMNEKTRKAILAYQRDWKLTETGEISKDLITRLSGDHPATQSRWMAVLLADNNGQCKFWAKEPGAEQSATWSGACLEGKANGLGKLVMKF